MLELFRSYLPLIGLVWTAITFFAGHMIGHKTALKRDKRKEYNALVSPVRVELMKQINSIHKNDFYTAQIKNDQILLISDLVSRSHASRILETYSLYSHATSFDGLKSTFGEYGLIHIGDTGPALLYAKKLLKLIPVK